MSADLPCCVQHEDARRGARAARPGTVPRGGRGPAPEDRPDRVGVGARRTWDAPFAGRLCRAPMRIDRVCRAPGPSSRATSHRPGRCGELRAAPGRTRPYPRSHPSRAGPGRQGREGPAGRQAGPPRSGSPPDPTSARGTRHSSGHCPAGCPPVRIAAAIGAGDARRAWVAIGSGRPSPRRAPGGWALPQGPRSTRRPDPARRQAGVTGGSTPAPTLPPLDPLGTTRRAAGSSCPSTARAATRRARRKRPGRVRTPRRRAAGGTGPPAGPGGRSG